MSLIYTIGTSTRTLEDFLNILKSLGIKNAIDVRRYPNSKRFPHFSRKSLQEALERLGIRYFYLGEKLGGFRPDPYKDYVETEDFKEGLSQLEDLARKDLSIFFCCERLFFRCHRRYIARALNKRGWVVYHVIDSGRLIMEKD